MGNVMRLFLMIGVIWLATGIVGCGETKPDREALSRAYHRGELTGRAKSEASASKRLSAAREEGYWEGLEEGWGEGWEEAEEAMEEELGYQSGTIDPSPLKQNGESSYEFEPDDIERAEEASQEVQEYCEGAVSEAQEVGCLSHVEPWEVP
jgi:hypothetical protein